MVDSEAWSVVYKLYEVIFAFIYILIFGLLVSVTVRPKLKSRYKRRVQAALACAKIIDDFDILSTRGLCAASS